MRGCLCHPKSKERILGSLCWVVQGVTTSLSKPLFSRGTLILGELWEGSSHYKGMSYQHLSSLARLVAPCQPTFS